MPRLSRTQQAVRQQIAQLGGSGLSPEQLSDQFLAAIGLAVPFDTAQLYALDPITLLFNRLLSVNDNGRLHVQWYLQNLYLKEPLAALTHPNLMRAGLTAVVINDRPETSLGLPAHITNQLSASEFYQAYHEVTSVAGGILRLFFPVEGQWVAALDLVRLEAHSPFRPTDVAFLQSVAPMIGRLLRAALDRERALDTTAVTPDTCGLFVLAPNGRLQTCTPAAEQWLTRLPGVGALWENHLPGVIWSVIAALRAGESRNGTAWVWVPTPNGPVRIEASPLGHDGSIAVMLIPHVPPAPPTMPANWNLTPQERQVVAAVVRGLSNQQIANALVITENTVESHLKHVYSKVNVLSRSQLIAHYFTQRYTPDLFE